MELKIKKQVNQESMKNRPLLSSPVVLILLIAAIALSSVPIFIFVFDTATSILVRRWAEHIDIAVLLLSLLFILVLLVWIRALFYVHRDSKARNMSSILWVLICLFFPYFLGFLVYFLVRSPVPEKCPGCQYVVTKGDKFCQQCGQKLATTCTKCGSSLTPEAIFCPGCGTKLVE